MCPTLPRQFGGDRRGVTSTVQAIVLVALVTVTMAGVGYLVLGVVLVDDSPDVEQVKIRISEDGVTITPMVGDRLPADETEFAVHRLGPDGARVTVDSVGRASRAADVASYVSVRQRVAATGDPAELRYLSLGEGDARERFGGETLKLSGSTVVAAVESNVGADAADPDRAEWRAGQPVHLETAAGFIESGDVLNVKLADRKHRQLLVDHEVRVSELPTTIIVDVDPTAGDDTDPMPSDVGQDDADVDRSTSGGVVDLGEAWTRSIDRGSTVASNPVVARAATGAGGAGAGAGGGSGGGTGAGSGPAAGTGGGSGSGGSGDGSGGSDGPISIDDPEVSMPVDGGSGGTSGGQPGEDVDNAVSDSGASTDAIGTGSTGTTGSAGLENDKGTITFSQTGPAGGGMNTLQDGIVYNPDGGPVVMENMEGEEVVAISAANWYKMVDDPKQESMKISEMPAGTQQRIRGNVENIRDIREEVKYVGEPDDNSIDEPTGTAGSDGAGDQGGSSSSNYGSSSSSTSSYERKVANKVVPEGFNSGGSSDSTDAGDSGGDENAGESTNTNTDGAGGSETSADSTESGTILGPNFQERLAESLSDVTPDIEIEMPSIAIPGI